MAQPDYQGARGSNAGDDFHELWVLRQALVLLDQDTELKAIAVEGLKAEDEKGVPKDVWDGVDCTFYYGGSDAATAKQIVIDQLKYSAANSKDGRLPAAERFHTYLEWHAMWCAIGELMQTRPLADLKDNDYRSLKYRISRHSLVNPPIWLADLRRSKPLERRFWFHPTENIDKWVNTVSDADFLTELGLADENIVIDGYHEIRSRNLRCSTQVHSALVSPKTAAALVRALQLVPHYSDYRLPSTGDDFEIDAPPYRLKAWLEDGESRSGIDERDPFRFDVSHIQALPADELTAAFDLVQSYKDHPVWLTTNGQEQCVHIELGVIPNGMSEMNVHSMEMTFLQAAIN